jgi:hypothetical protein
MSATKIEFHDSVAVLRSVVPDDLLHPAGDGCAEEARAAA